MKQNSSKSRALRRKLLTAMIVCFVTIMIICVSVFNIVYNRSSKIVADHTSKTTDNTVDATAHGFDQVELANSRKLLSCIGKEMGYRLYTEYDPSECDEGSFLWSEINNYFMTDPWASTSSSIGFFYADGTFYSLPSYQEHDEIISNAVAALNEDISADPEYYGEGSTIQSIIEKNYNAGGGIYTFNGNGYIIAWDNLINYMETRQGMCYGMISYDQNSCKELINQISEEQNSQLTKEMDALFSSSLYAMIAVISGVLFVFIAVSVVLSKKLADPVVSEHDMLVQVNEMKTTFLSDASHELKTPLTAMSGYAQNAEMELVNGGNTAIVREELKRISSEANRMALMVTQILDVTRIEEGRMVLEITPCDIDSLVRGTVETYFAVLNKNNNRLVLRIPLELPKVKADSSKLQRVFVNLISNALKHTQNGTILIKAEQENNFIKVTVKDTGCGISEEDMPHIWERYYKGKHSETGTGLGLFICKFIIESHGGKIWAESIPEKGTSFIFTLPLDI